MRNEKTLAKASVLSGAGNGTRTRDNCLGKAVLYQLSYSRNYGGNYRARTCDILLVRQTLSQLSYTPIFLKFFKKFLVGMTGFEPAALWSQTRCATKLRYIPIPVYYNPSETVLQGAFLKKAKDFDRPSKYSD